MKSLMILGALLGFGIGMLFALAGRSAWPSALWHAAGAALVAGLLMRWWGRVWIKGLREAREQQLAALLEARRKAAQKN